MGYPGEGESADGGGQSDGESWLSGENSPMKAHAATRYIDILTREFWLFTCCW